MAISQGASPHRAWISVNGTQFPVEHGNVSLQTGASGASHFSVAIPMSLPGAYDFFANVGENTTEVWASTSGLTDVLITGMIKGVTFDMVGRYINVTGQDNGTKLHNRKSAEKWTNKKGSEIVQELCGRVGLPAQCDASKLPAGKKLEQDFVKLTDNISYAAVIHLLSRFDGARVFTDKRGTFHYQLQQSGGSYSLNYKPPSTSSPMRADFLLLFIHRNVEASMGSDHHIMSWHAKEKKKYIGKSSVKGSGTPRQYVYHFPTLDQAHADQHAKARAAEVARHQIELRVTCAGDPTIDLMQQLVLTGTGAFDQSYTIDSITHEFGMSGHEMSITTKGPKGSGSGFSEDFFW